MKQNNTTFIKKIGAVLVVMKLFERRLKKISRPVVIMSCWVKQNRQFFFEVCMKESWIISYTIANTSVKFYTAFVGNMLIFIEYT